VEAITVWDTLGYISKKEPLSSVTAVPATSYFWYPLVMIWSSNAE